MKFLSFILLIFLSACKQHSKPLVIQENKPVILIQHNKLRYFFIGYNTINGSYGNGYIVAEELPDFDTLRKYISGWIRCKTISSDSIIVTGIYEYKDSSEFSRVNKSKIISNCKPIH